MRTTCWERCHIEWRKRRRRRSSCGKTKAEGLGCQATHIRWKKKNRFLYLIITEWSKSHIQVLRAQLIFV
jgi:hypothetical protein